MVSGHTWKNAIWEKETLAEYWKTFNVSRHAWDNAVEDLLIHYFDYTWSQSYDPELQRQRCKNLQRQRCKNLQRN
jgi:hypothetical protein